MQELLTVPEVARRLAIAPRTVYARWREWGLTPVRIGGGTTGALRFRATEVARLAEQWSG